MAGRTTEGIKGRITRRWTLLVAIATIMTVGIGVMPAGASGATGSCPKPGDRVSAEEVIERNWNERCDLVGVVVEDHGVAAEVPPNGSRVYTEAYTTSGSEELSLETADDGATTLRFVGSEIHGADAMGLSGTTSAPDACSDPAYEEAGWTESDSYRFFFNRATTPSGLTRDQAEDAIFFAGLNIDLANNDCGLSDNIDTSTFLAGDTMVHSNIGSDGTCESVFVKDEVNVIDFGDLPATSEVTTLGTACVWSAPYLFGREVLEADIKLNKVEADWTVYPESSSCSNRFDVESVVTHELGHVWGLSHRNLSESDHANLTMSPMINGPCQLSERTLGLGDIRGLESLY